MTASGPARERVGLIPAAGAASRIAPLPCSKELLPVGWQPGDAPADRRPKVVSQYLLERMRIAGASRAFFIVREGKWDIARYFGDGSRLDLPIGYLHVGEPWGPPFTLAQATPFIGEADVLFGFPDILVDPVDSFVTLLRRLDDTGADVVLGLFDCPAGVAGDLVDCDADGRITRLQPKEANPVRPAQALSWMFAVWRASFTRFLTAECRRLAPLARRQVERDPVARPPEWPVGAIVAAAIEGGLRVEGHRFAQGRFLDVGTPDGLVAAADFPLVWNGVPRP